MKNLLFRKSPALSQLHKFVYELVDEYVCVVEVRVAGEKNKSLEFFELATGLDKFHRRLLAIAQLLPETDFTE